MRLRDLTASARVGRGGALAVVGPAGSGKTALLDAAIDDATGMRVLRTAGAERVVAPPLAGLADLCRPLGDVLPELPEADSVTLAAAFGEEHASGVPVDRFAVYIAAANLLVSASRRTPLLVVVDDAHLLDEPSREAVGVVANRVSGTSIALVVATEDAPPEGTDMIGLRPLDRIGALTLLDRRFGARLAAKVAADVADVAEGNPLALLEIPRTLTGAQRSGLEPAASALDSVRSAEQAFLTRISMLPPDTRQALVVAALGNGESPTVIEGALTELGLGDHVFEPAIAAGLVERSRVTVVFCHELARATVAYGALRTERRAAHAALASAEDTCDTRAWHRALSLAAPDEGAAAELADTAERAASRGVWATAAQAFALAARATPDTATRAQRLVAAADAAQRAGSVAAAIDHLEEALAEMQPSEARAEAELLLGGVLTRSGSAARARDVLLDAAVAAPYPPATRSRLLSAAVIPTLRAGDPAAAIATGRQALALTERDGPDELSAVVALGTALALAGDHPEARDLALLGRALTSDGRLGLTPSQRAYIGFALRLVGERAAARDELEGAIDTARSSGLV
ncbi:MAG: AAA family ATPase, partial [Gaiella sp.]